MSSTNTPTGGERGSKIRLEVECGAAKLYINEFLYLLLYPDRINAIQSWRQDGAYFIEYYFKEGEPVKSEYSFEDWKTVLELLNTLSTLKK